MLNLGPIDMTPVVLLAGAAALASILWKLWDEGVRDE